MAMETARTPEQLQEALSNPEQVSKMVEAGILKCCPAARQMTE